MLLFFAVLFNHSSSDWLMFGGFIENHITNINVIPDLWIKIYPIRMIIKNKKNPDLSIGINYSNNLKYGVGVSIPY